MARFSLHLYIQQLLKDGASEKYIQLVYKNAKILSENNLPVVLTLGHLAYITNVPYYFLIGVIKRKLHPYKVFSIKKRKGGKRNICVPETLLLKVQRWIHTHILCSDTSLRKLTSQVTAYAPKKSHIHNAQQHLGAKYLLKLDLTSFFESISERQIYYVFRDLGYGKLVAFCLTRLCTRVLPRLKDGRYNKKRWGKNNKNY